MAQMFQLSNLKSMFGKKKQIKEVAVTTPTVVKENTQLSQDWIKGLINGNITGYGSKFVSDIYKNRILYPHEEMQIAQKGFYYNSYINSATTTRANFMLGGSFTAVSEVPGIADFINQLIQDTNLARYPTFIGCDLIKCGNWYAERIRGEDKKVVFYKYLSHPERIYIELDKYELIDFYVQEVPEKTVGDITTIQYYGDRRRTIKGVKINKDKMFHLKLGVAEIPVYGRGPVCSVINDIEILLEIERAIAVIARHKAVPKKIIQLMRTMQDGRIDATAAKAAEDLGNQLSQLSDIENPVLGEQIKVDDLSYNGKDISFQPFVDYLKKKITVALAPSFIMHGEETNYAVSRDQKEAFLLQIHSERLELEYQIKKEIIYLCSTHGKNIKMEQFSIKFGEFDLGQSLEKADMAIKSFTSGLITLNEAREIIGLEPDGEIGDSYSNELNQQAGLLGLGSDSGAFNQNNAEQKTQ